MLLHAEDNIIIRSLAQLITKHNKAQYRMENIEKQYFYLFINTESGNRIGKKYLTIPQKTLTYVTENRQSNIFFYDFLDKTDKQKGLKDAKAQSQCMEIHIVICGGDGTVVWVMSEVHDFGIDTENVVFSVIPIGSGNDFSRTLNWGSQPILFDKFHLDPLLELVKKWQKAEKVDYDLWDVKIDTHENGRILTLREDEENSRGRKQLKQTFANYFGIGVDGRVAYTSQKNRVDNIVLNKIIYGVVGFFCFFNPAPSIRSLLTKIVSRVDDRELQSVTTQSSPDPNQPTELEESFIDENSPKKVKPVSLLKNLHRQQNNIPMKSSWHTIVCLNGKNFMAGVKNIWKPNCQRNQENQNFGDGKLEIVGFRNELSLVLERLVSLADNVYQAEGQVELQFRKKEQVRTFIQIDGQPMVLINPKKISIKHSSISKTGKIKVLYNQLKPSL